MVVPIQRAVSAMVLYIPTGSGRWQCYPLQGGPQQAAARRYRMGRLRPQAAQITGTSWSPTDLSQGPKWPPGRRSGPRVPQPHQLHNYTLDHDDPRNRPQGTVLGFRWARASTGRHDVEMVHNVALVLGGGGAAGNAWEIGIIAGLAEAGLDMTEAAELVVGTSAGATTATQVRSSIPPAELLATVLSGPARPVGQNRERPPSLPMATVFERMRAIGAAATSPADLQRAMGAFGLESDSILGPGAGQRRAVVAARVPRPEWPDRPMIVVAIEVHTGELAAFDRDSGVELMDAVTASTALPGLVPTVSINAARYIDGGVRSPDNADLASGYANVVVLSPLGGRSGTLPEGQFEGLRRPPGAVESVRALALSRADEHTARCRVMRSLTRCGRR